VTHFISNSRPNVKGLILAGSANFKMDLAKSDLFDQRLKPIILDLVDVSYGMENGFNQAITLSEGVLSDVKLIQEKKLLRKFFSEISQDSEMVSFGIEDTLKAIEYSAADTLILTDSLDIQRTTLKSKLTEEIKVVYGSPNIKLPTKLVKCAKDDEEYEEVERMLLVEWLCENSEAMNLKIELLSDNFEESAQFSKGFGGIGAFLRYKVNLEVEGECHDEEEKKQDEADDDDDFI